MIVIVSNCLWLIAIGISLGHVQAQPTVDIEELSSCQQVLHQIDVLALGNENVKLRLAMMEHHFEKQQQHQQNIQREFRSLTEIIQKLQTRLLEQEDSHHNEIKQLLATRESKECKQGIDTQADKQPEILKEIQKLTKLQEDILTKLDTEIPSTRESIKLNTEAASYGKGNEIATEKVEGVNVCWGIYTKILGELNSNLTILQNIDSKLGKLNEQYTEESERHKKSLGFTHGLLKFLNKREEGKICVRSNDQKLVCTAEPHPTSCADYDPIQCAELDGKCRIKNLLYGPETFLVPCDDETDGGGWTIIQRRINGSVDFYRDWSEYKTGFGNLDGEFWLGLDKLHALTTTLAPVELLVQLKDHNDTLKYAKYGKFLIGSELELYALKEIDDYEGNAGDSLSNHKGYKFSTKDKDNDAWEKGACAVDKRGAWWYKSCLWSNLNGMYYKTGIVPENVKGRGMNWETFGGYSKSFKFVQMMIRPNKK